MSAAGHTGPVRRAGLSSLSFAPVVFALACAPAVSDPPAPAATTVARWGAAPDPDEREAMEAPLDPRRVRLDAAAYQGTERTCEVVYRGQATSLPAIDGRAYDPPRTRRLSVRCGGQTGAGWADLVFDDASQALAELVAVGQRLTVRVESGRGHRNVPVLSFVAFQSGPPAARATPGLPGPLAPSLEPPAAARERPAGSLRDAHAEALLAEVPVGEDWATLPTSGEAPRACALLSVGEPDPVPADRGYAPDATHHLPVRCRGPRGPVRVDVTFSADKRLASLRFRRGEVVPLTPVARTPAGVRARYAGP